MTGLSVCLCLWGTTQQARAGQWLARVEAPDGTTYYPVQVSYLANSDPWDDTKQVPEQSFSWPLPIDNGQIRLGTPFSGSTFNIGGDTFGARPDPDNITSDFAATPRNQNTETRVTSGSVKVVCTWKAAEFDGETGQWGPDDGSKPTEKILLLTIKSYVNASASVFSPTATPANGDVVVEVEGVDANADKHPVGQTETTSSGTKLYKSLWQEGEKVIVKPVPQGTGSTYEVTFDVPAIYARGHIITGGGYSSGCDYASAAYALGPQVPVLSPDPANLALYDGSSNPGPLNQYVITNGIPTSIAVYGGYANEWVRANASWNITGMTPPLLPFEPNIVSGGYVQPVQMESLTAAGGHPYQSVVQHVLGLQFGLKTQTSPSSDSNMGWVFPSSNSQFGVKTLNHVVNGVTVSAPIALFYPSTGYQHPYGGPKGYYDGYIGCPEVDTPNWFYYYSQAWPAPCEIRYSANSNSQYNNNDSFVWVGSEAHGARDSTYLFGRLRAANGSLGPLREVGGEQTKGIDTYVRVITHEYTHKRCYEHIHSGVTSDNDRDTQGNIVGDEVPDDWEVSVGLNPNTQDTLDWVASHQGDFPSYTSANGDDEVFARMHERGVFGPILQDWAAGSNADGNDFDSGLNYGSPSAPNRCKRLQPFPNSPITLQDLEDNVEYAGQP